jgi:transcriptional regulator with XRE-family HTH domain
MPRTATSTIDAKVVGASLRRARMQQDLTQAELAKRLSVSGAYVQKIEAGRANPTLGQLANVARALGRTLSVEFTQAPEPVDPLAGYAAL